MAYKHDAGAQKFHFDPWQYSDIFDNVSYKVASPLTDVSGVKILTYFDSKSYFLLNNGPKPNQVVLIFSLSAHKTQRKTNIMNFGTQKVACRVRGCQRRFNISRPTVFLRNFQIHDFFTTLASCSQNTCNAIDNNTTLLADTLIFFGIYFLSIYGCIPV
jgi:hypothetical protein